MSVSFVNRTGQIWQGEMQPWDGIFLIVESEPHCQAAHPSMHHKTVNLETGAVRWSTEMSMDWRNEPPIWWRLL